MPTWWLRVQVPSLAPYFDFYIMKVSSFLSEDDILIGINESNRNGALKKLIRLLVKNKKIKPDLEKKIFNKIIAREKLGSTAIGQGVAIPHIRLGALRKIRLVIGICVNKKGIDFESLDGEPVYLIFLLISPQSQEGLHLKILATISRFLRDKHFLEAIKSATSSRQVLKLIERKEHE